jgi:hypothetical protein
MVVLLRLGAPMNRLPPESARTSYFSRDVRKEIKIRWQTKLPVNGALWLCASVFTGGAIPEAKGPAQSMPCISGKC